MKVWISNQRTIDREFRIWHHITVKIWGILEDMAWPRAEYNHHKSTWYWGSYKIHDYCGFLGVAVDWIKITVHSHSKTDRNGPHPHIHQSFKVCTNILIMLIIFKRTTKIIMSNSRHNEKSSLYDFIKPWLNEGLLISSGKQ